MQAAANAYQDKVQEKAFKMSSCNNDEDWWYQTMRCHAYVADSPLCVRVNTISAFQEANRLIPHNLAVFELQKLGSSMKNKVHIL